MTYVDTLEAAWADHLAPRLPDAPTVVSTFAGCGGSSLGYSMAGFRELLAVEWDDNSVETFRLNFPDIPVYHDDIARLSVDEALSLAGIAPGDLDVLDGSPPCQGFSTAGKREMSDDRNRLFLEFTRLLAGLRPRVFVMENVSGMVKGKMRLIFVEILRELKACGYRVAVRLLDAQYFGVPQMRQRVIFIGIRDDIGIEPTHPTAYGRPISVREAWEGIAAMSYVIPTGEVARRFLYIRPGRSGDLGDGRKYSTKKLSFDRPSQTLPKQIGPSYALHLHPSEFRSVSIEEAKRISSFPDSFQLIGTYQQQWARLGNSVPPLFMRAIALHIRATVLDQVA